VSVFSARGKCRTLPLAVELGAGGKPLVSFGEYGLGRCRPEIAVSGEGMVLPAVWVHPYILARHRIVVHGRRCADMILSKP
jgi:hypothetical protein